MTDADRGEGARMNLRLLFSPISIGAREVKNRIVSSAHNENMADHGLLNERVIRYYERKAAGGAGLIMTFGSGSVYKKNSAPHIAALWNPENEPFLKQLAERVHAHGALIMSQATHRGRRAHSEDTGYPLQAPSAVPEPVHKEIPQALSTDEIKRIVEAFADTAACLERCGWDGVEITSYGGHLIEQFWSPTVNQRTDEYGGGLESRMRFSREVIETVAAAVSREFIVGFRMTGDPLTDVIGLDQDDMLEIATRINDLGRIDLFNISGGTGATLASQAGTVPPDAYARGCYNHLARRMKEHLSVPVLVAGRVLDPQQAEEALASGDCDLVAMTRAIIADPDLPRKAFAGEVSRIRPCIAINEGCIGRGYQGLSIQCAVNPGVAYDSLSDFAPADRRRRVVVVGGGSAGMEAARVATERGHDVSLFESTGRLGGQVLAAKAAPDRPHFGRHVAWLERELERLGVDVRLGVEGTVDRILAAEPEAVVLATGARTIIAPEAEGVRARCVTDVDLLEGKLTLKQRARALVFDVEGLRGGYAANFLAEAGASRIELVSPLLTVCEGLDSTNQPPMYRRLAKNNVVCTPNQTLAGEREVALIMRDVWSDQERVVEDVDLIVFAGIRVAMDTLTDSLYRAEPSLEIHRIGDCVAPRLLRDAVTEGVRAGNAI